MPYTPVTHISKMKREMRRATDLHSLPPSSSSSSPPQRFLLFLLLLSTMSMPEGVRGVQVHKVKVPRPGVAGRPATLECLWTAGTRGFYSVRWYKNDEQFYSFVPKNKPQVKVDHHLKGVSVELDESDERVVSLRELRLDSEGEYRCEVMSESPYFKSSFGSNNLTVVALPEAPTLTGLRPRYRVGETLNVTCTAKDTRPAAQLTFFMNGEPITPESGRMRTLSVRNGSQPGLFDTSAVLERPLGRRHVPSVSVVCSAQVSTVSTKVEVNVEVQGHSGSAPLFLLNTGSGPSPAFPAPLLLPLVLTFPHLLGAAR